MLLGVWGRVLPAIIQAMGGHGKWWHGAVFRQLLAQLPA
jgi:hypothetical protein